MLSICGHMTTKKSRALNEDDFEIAWIDNIFREKHTPEEQIPLIIAEIEATPIYYKQINNICSHLDYIIKYYYKGHNVNILPFGSSVTKLALRESDVDLFLDFEGVLPKPTEEFARSLKKLVVKRGFFRRSIFILARVPVVQCIHHSGIVCDISFVNKLGVSNSNLVKYLVSIDNRIRPLILILKFLMKKQGIIGPNAITSHALIVLVIYFLQNLEKPIIPSISHLQALAEAKEIVADWDVSFVKDSSAFAVTCNTSSITQLLKQFFELYSKFEFGFYIVSSFLGKPLLKPLFQKPDLLPKEFSCYKNNVAKNSSYTYEYKKFMCTQGPFNHSNNVTRNVSQKILQRFQNICLNSMKLCYGELEGNGKPEFFKKLFSQNIDQKVRKLKTDEKEANFTIHVGEKINFNESSVVNEDDLRKQWCEHVLIILNDILTKVMKCTVSSNCDDYEVKCNKYINVQIIKLFDCELHNFNIIKRNDVKKEFDFPQNMSMVNQEEIISNYLYDVVLKNNQKDSIKFQIICSMQKEPTILCFYFEHKEKTKVNINLSRQIFHFMQCNFPKWIKQLI